MSARFSEIAAKASIGSGERLLRPGGAYLRQGVVTLIRSSDSQTTTRLPGVPARPTDFSGSAQALFVGPMLNSPASAPWVHLPLGENVQLSPLLSQPSLLEPCRTYHVFAPPSFLHDSHSP